MSKKDMFLNENLDNILEEADKILKEEAVQQPTLSGLTSLQAVLTKELYNIRILHWKVCTKNFDGTHKLMDEYTTVLNGYIDEIAEMCMMVGALPCTIEEAAGANVSLNMSDNYDRMECFRCLEGIFGRLISAYDKALSYTLPDDMKDVLKMHLFYIRKEMQYKNARRLMEK